MADLTPEQYQAAWNRNEDVIAAAVMECMGADQNGMSVGETMAMLSMILGKLAGSQVAAIANLSSMSDGRRQLLTVGATKALLQAARIEAAAVKGQKPDPGFDFRSMLKDAQ